MSYLDVFDMNFAKIQLNFLAEIIWEKYEANVSNKKHFVKVLLGSISENFVEKFEIWLKSYLI